MRLAVFVAASALTACAAKPAPPAREPEVVVPVTLAVAGARNAMPSLAVSGDRVVAVWTATKDDVMNVYAATSGNGGATFSEARRVNDVDGDVSSNAEQPPRVAMAGSSITVVWPSKKSGATAIRMARSADGGASFSQAITIHNPALKGYRGWQGVTAAADGAVHVVWLDGRDAEPRAAPHAHGTMNHAGMAAMKASPRQDVYHATIAPDGSIAESHVARDVCFCCKTAVAVGPGGRVNVAWRHIFPGSLRDIAMATSTDGGRTFGALARVSEDQWAIAACPDDGPAMVVDSADRAHLVWPTLVNVAEPQKAVFYTSTEDGKAFASRVRLSDEKQSDAAHPQIAVNRAGQIAAAWDEQGDEMRRIVLRVSPGPGAGFGAPAILNEGYAAFHPFVAASGDGFLVAWTRGPAEQSAIVVRRVTPK